MKRIMLIVFIVLNLAAGNIAIARQIPPADSTKDYTEKTNHNAYEKASLSLLMKLSPLSKEIKSGLKNDVPDSKDVLELINETISPAIRLK